MKKLVLNAALTVLSLALASVSMANETKAKTSAIVTCPSPAVYISDPIPPVTIERADGTETFKNCAQALDVMENTELAYLDSVNSLGNGIVVYTYLMNTPHSK